MNLLNSALVLISLSLLMAGVFADSTYCDNAGIAGGTWSLPNNARTDSGGWSYTSAGAQTLTLRSFNCQIPDGSEINSITVYTDSWGSIGFAIISVNLSKNSCSSTVGNTLSHQTTTSETTYTHAGGLWGTTWTAAQLNAETFCIQLKTPKTLISGDTENEDWVRPFIDFTPPPSASVLSGIIITPSYPLLYKPVGGAKILNKFFPDWWA